MYFIYFCIRSRYKFFCPCLFCTHFVLALLQDKKRCSNQYVCKFCKENYNLKQTKTNYPNPHSVLNGYDKYKTNEYGKLEKNF